MGLGDFILKHSHRLGTDTERDAAAAQYDTLTDRCREVYQFLLRRGAQTDEEGTEASGIHSYRRRRADLKNLGLVKDSGLRRANRRGRLMIVWMAVTEQEAKGTRKPLGDCFKQAADTLTELDEPGAEVVHGIVTCLVKGSAVYGVRHYHAWVESNGLVIDTSNGHFALVPVPVYYEAGGIDPEWCRRYDAEGLLANLAATGNFGPWDLPECDVNYDSLQTPREKETTDA